MKFKLVFATIAALLVAACSSGTGGAPAVDMERSAASSSRATGSPPFYNVKLFGAFGGTQSNAASINERGWIAGSADQADNATSHAAIWGDGAPKDLQTLGGPSSAIAWPNLDNFGMAAGISEKLETNPYNEPWSCWVFFPYANPSYHECVGFRWQNDKMVALSTLGGPDGYAAGTNDEGRIVGWAENTTQDQTCDSGQVLQFEPVYWDRSGVIHQLPTLEGDPDGAATANNDSGQIVGISGTCDQAVGRFTATHMVIWNSGGAVRLLAKLQSVSWNTPTAINQSGQVTGFVNIPGGGDPQGQLQPIAFLWSRGTLTDINPLGTDAYSQGEGINDEGDVVGVSYGAGFSTARAFLYHKGKAYDLNGLTAPGSPYLLVANAVDDRGNIVGQAVDANGDLLAFVARLPSDMQLKDAQLASRAAAVPMRLPLSVRYRLLRRWGAVR